MPQVVFPLSGGLGPLGVARGESLFTPWSPLSLTPSLWLDAGLSPRFQLSGGTVPATADTDPVGYVGDLSGNGRHVTQATAGSRPLLKLAIQNGLPVLRFDGADDFLSAVFTRSQPTTVVCVGVVSASGNCTVYDAAGGNAGRLFSNPGTNEHLTMYAGGAALPANTTVAQGAWFVSTAVFDGASSLQRVNGVEMAGSLGASQGSGIYLGVFGAGAGAPLQGDVAALLVFDRALSSPDRTDLETYLNSRWGVY